MTKAQLRQLRLDGRLQFLVNFRESTRDQSGNGNAVTIPASASIGPEGLRVDDAPVTVQLDMTDIDEFFVYFEYSGLQQGLSSQYPLYFSTDITSNTTGWAILMQSNPRAYMAYRNTLGQVDALTNVISVLNQGVVGFHVNRKLTKDSIRPYNQKIYDLGSQTILANKDGAKFGDHLLHIGSFPTGASKFEGVIHEVGIYTGAPL
jgi:hypothetical protein